MMTEDITPLLKANYNESPQKEALELLLNSTQEFKHSTTEKVIPGEKNQVFAKIKQRNNSSVKITK